jgi:ubiquinone/menaquinone biosynthesis C-methylase UbiE
MGFTPLFEIKNDFHAYISTQKNKYESFESSSQHYIIGQERFLNQMFADINKEDKILDIACGDGVGLKWFRDNGYKNVFGFELNENKVQIAKQTGFEIFIGDMHNLNCFNDNTFDVVYSSHTLEHALNPFQVLSEFKRILKNSGIFILVIPFPDKGPDDAHCGKYILKSDFETAAKDPQASLLINFLNEFGFKCVYKKFDSFREDEIWLKLINNKT